MNQPITYEDRCSRCGQPVIRLRRNLGAGLGLPSPYLYKHGPAWRTSCCGAAPVAKAVS